MKLENLNERGLATLMIIVLVITNLLANFVRGL